MKVFSIFIFLFVTANIFSQEAEIAKFCKDNKTFGNFCNTFKYTDLANFETNPNLMVYSLIKDISADLMNKQGEINKIKDLVSHNSFLVLINRFLNNNYDLELYYPFSFGVINDIDNHIYKKILRKLDNSKSILSKLNDDSLKQTKEDIEFLTKYFTEVSVILITKANDPKIKPDDIQEVRDKQLAVIDKMKEILKRTNNLKKNELNPVIKDISDIIEMTEVSTGPFKPIIKGYYSYYKNTCMEDNYQIESLDICNNFKEAKTEKSIKREIFILNLALRVIEFYKNDNINYYKELAVYKDITIALLKKDIDLLTIAFSDYFTFAKTDVKVSKILIKTLQNSNLFYNKNNKKEKNK